MAHAHLQSGVYLEIGLFVTKLKKQSCFEEEITVFSLYKLLMPFLHEAIEKLIGNSLKTFAAFFQRPICCMHFYSTLKWLSVQIYPLQLQHKSPLIFIGLQFCLACF